MEELTSILSPIWLNYLAAIHGFPTVNLEETFYDGQIANGEIETLKRLAAAYPQGQFVHISPDFMTANVPPLDFLSISSPALETEERSFFLKKNVKNNGLCILYCPQMRHYNG